jgi:hypothetical protein
MEKFVRIGCQSVSVMRDEERGGEVMYTSGISITYAGCGIT